MKKKKCSACGRDMLMVPGPNGKEIPLDATAPVYEIKGDLLADPHAEPVQAFVSHFATCTDPDRFSARARLTRPAASPYRR